MAASARYVQASTGSALPTSACVRCGQGSATPLRIPRTYPLGLLFGIACALPLLLAITIAAIWGSRDLFDMMAGTGGRKPLELHILRALPIVVPAVLSIAALVALEMYCRTLGLRLNVCRTCAVRQRRSRTMLITVLALAFVALAAVLYLAPVVQLFDRKWAILFAPWIVLAALLANETPLAGMRIHAHSPEIQRIRGAPAITQVLQRERPDALLADVPTRFWPPRLDLWAFVVPVVLVAIAIAGPRLEPFPLECAYGTYPLSHRSGLARVIGCRAPDGTAHGHSRGEASAWNSNPHSPGYSGTWWFGQPHGPMTFLDAKGRVLAEGRYTFGRPSGRWQLFDEWGTLTEDLEIVDGPARTIVHRAHPHLECSRSEIEATGMPAWGTRACPRYDAPAPFVRVENARVVEAGMR